MRGIAACLVAGVAGGAFAFACGSSGGGGDQTIVDSGTPETTTPPPSDAADDRTFPIDAPANEQVLGGSRLKPKVMRTSDGASAFVTWHDIMLDIDCAFSVAQDGALRCLPNEAAENGYGNTWLREWTDMTCTTTPMLLDKRDGYDACPPPKYFASRDEAMCPGKVRVEPIGAQLAATKYSYEDRMQPCQPNNSLSPPDVAWSLGAVVPPETFVRGTLSLSDPKDGVAVAYITGEDGSKGFYQFVDTVHENEPCVFARASDGVTRCLPQGGDWGTVWDDLFVEGTCSTPWAQLLYYTKCPTKFGWQDTDRASCNPGFHVYPIGASVTGSHVWISMGAESCTDDGASQNQGFTTGPEIPAATFSTVTAGPNYGTTRLVRTTQVTSGGIVMAGGWFDTKRSQACSAFADATGTLRCMPNGNSATTYYSDATCTQPLYQDYAAACGVPPPAQVELMVVDHTTCPAHYRVYEKGASYTGTVYEKYGIGACTTTTTLPPSPLYSLGAEIAPTDLADFTEVVVP